MEIRRQSTLNHNISLSLSTIWVQEDEYIEEKERNDVKDCFFSYVI